MSAFDGEMAGMGCAQILLELAERQHAAVRAIVDARLRELGLWDAASSAGGEAFARAHKAACIRSFSDAF